MCNYERIVERIEVNMSLVNFPDSGCHLMEL